MFDNLKLNRLLACFLLAGKPAWMATISSELGFPAVKVNLRGYPSYYFLRLGEWFRQDVAYPGATAEVQVPHPTPVGVIVQEPPQIVCLLAVREAIDARRRMVYPLSQDDLSGRPPDWDATVETRSRELIDEYLRFVVRMGELFPKQAVRDVAGGIIVEQRGQIGLAKASRPGDDR